MIHYSDLKLIRPVELERLFLAVKWSSGKHPDKLHKSIENSYLVLSAWENDELIGLINCLSDGNMYAYIPYLLVHPDKQHMGIGTKLLHLLMEDLKDMHRIVLLSEKETRRFYLDNGFEHYADAFPMHRTFTSPKT